MLEIQETEVSKDDKLLLDMGLSPDREVEIVQDGHHFRLYKIVVPGTSPAGPQGRFQ